MWLQWSWLRTWPSNWIFWWPWWIFRFRNVAVESRFSTVDSISQSVNHFVSCRDTGDIVNKFLVSGSVIQLLFIQWLSLPVSMWVSEFINQSVEVYTLNSDYCTEGVCRACCPGGRCDSISPKHLHTAPGCVRGGLTLCLAGGRLGSMFQELWGRPTLQDCGL